MVGQGDKPASFLGPGKAKLAINFWGEFQDLLLFTKGSLDYQHWVFQSLRMAQLVSSGADLIIHVTMFISHL